MSSIQLPQALCNTEDFTRLVSKARFIQNAAKFGSPLPEYEADVIAGIIAANTFRNSGLALEQAVHKAFSYQILGDSSRLTNCIQQIVQNRLVISASKGCLNRGEGRPKGRVRNRSYSVLGMPLELRQVLDKLGLLSCSDALIRTPPKQFMQKLRKRMGQEGGKKAPSVETKEKMVVEESKEEPSSQRVRRPRQSIVLPAFLVNLSMPDFRQIEMACIFARFFFFEELKKKMTREELQVVHTFLDISILVHLCERPLQSAIESRFAASSPERVHIVLQKLSTILSQMKEKPNFQKIVSPNNGFCQCEWLTNPLKFLDLATSSAFTKFMYLGIYSTLRKKERTFIERVLRTWFLVVHLRVDHTVAVATCFKGVTTEFATQAVSKIVPMECMVEESEEVTWEDISSLSFFNNEEHFQLLIQYVKEKPTVDGLLIQIKSMGVLHGQHSDLQWCLSRCLSPDVLVKILGPDNNKNLRTLFNLLKGYHRVLIS